MLPELTSMCLGVDCTSLWNSIRGMLDFPSSVVWMIVVGYSDSDIISHVVCLLFLRMVFIHFCTLCLSIWAIGPVHIFLSLTKHWVKPVVHVGVDKSSLIIFLQIERVVCRLPHRYFWLPVCLLLAQLNWGERNVAQSRDLFKKKYIFTFMIWITTCLSSGNILAIWENPQTTLSTIFIGRTLNPDKMLITSIPLGCGTNISEEYLKISADETKTTWVIWVNRPYHLHHLSCWSLCQLSAPLFPSHSPFISPNPSCRVLFLSLTRSNRRAHDSFARIRVISVRNR